MFKYDPIALETASKVLNGNDFDALSIPEKLFIIMPFMHSEDIHVARRGYTAMRNCARQHIMITQGAGQGVVKALSEMDVDNHILTKSFREHLDLLERFGRYPHRNALLGRETTEEERVYLETASGFAKSVEKEPSTDTTSSDV